jgi:signal transduction histidine kinase
LLRPYALFGLEGLDSLTHCLFWSGLFNIGLFVAVSLFDRPTVSERSQAVAFAEPYGQGDRSPFVRAEWTGAIQIGDLHGLVTRLLGPDRADAALSDYSAQRGARLDPRQRVDGDLLRFVERLLTGVIGAASARVALTSLIHGRIGSSEVMTILDEATQVIEYSRTLEHKSAELELASAALKAANERLQELDRLKDDFLSTVTHELRTPLTAVRSLSEILYDNPELELEQRQEFLGLVIKESERLTRLINQLLDMAKMEASAVEWHIEEVDLGSVVRDAIASTGSLFRDKGISLQAAVPNAVPRVQADRDRLIQVLVNLLSNAVKFSPASTGSVEVGITVNQEFLEVRVRDNGPGIAAEDLEVVFDKFRQAGETMTDKPAGTGLGLAISRRIVEHLGGRIWVESEPGRGAEFKFTIPRPDADGFRLERAGVD